MQAGEKIADGVTEVRTRFEQRGGGGPADPRSAVRNGAIGAGTFVPIVTTP